MVRHQPVKARTQPASAAREEGGLDAAFFSIYMPGTITGPEAVKRSLILIDRSQPRREAPERDRARDDGGGRAGCHRRASSRR
jgi:hypothetical protein